MEKAVLLLKLVALVGELKGEEESEALVGESEEEFVREDVRLDDEKSPEPLEYTEDDRLAVGVTGVQLVVGVVWIKV